MKTLDDYYDIRLAAMLDIPNLMDFIKIHWKEDHILATSLEFFEYEMVINGQVNYVVAYSKESGELCGIHGFIPASLDNTKLDLWGAIWKTADGAKPMLGMELKKKLMRLTGARADIGVGANPNTAVPILTFYGYEAFRMRHYYLLNPKAEYKISEINEYKFGSILHYDISVEKISDFEQLDHKFNYAFLEQKIPYKDSWYIRHRYFEHPIYKYQIYRAVDRGSELILVAREQHYFDTKVLRLVDLIGDESLIRKMGDFFQEILFDYEYLDVYFAGISANYFEEAGFIERKIKDKNIIPNYFEPYVRENVEIWVNSNVRECVFFKADGDQDRPNYWRKKV